MEINRQRLIKDLETISGFTDTPGAGVTRFSYGTMDGKVREFLAKEAAQFGFSIREDPVGNLRLGLSQNQPQRATILAGSHLDSVQNGGALDGALGSLGALEVLRVLEESGQSFGWNVEAVIFAEEEGSNFSSTLTGSKFAVGIYKDKDMDRLKNDRGDSLRELLAGKYVMEGESMPLPWDFREISAMLELHIEQGPVLEREGQKVGVVEGIFGMRLVELTLQGMGNHAGASPMAGRRDALAAAAECILLAEREAREDPAGLAVATVGKIHVEPGSTNVIPETVRLTVEVRHALEKEIDRIMDEIIQASREACSQRGILFSVREVAKNPPIRLEEGMVTSIAVLAKAKGIPFRTMWSGAVHDASMMAAHTRVGMIFVPSIGGRSHVREEDTLRDDMAAGAELLLESVLSLLG